MLRPGMFLTGVAFFAPFLRSLHSRRERARVGWLDWGYLFSSNASMTTLITSSMLLITSSFQKRNTRYPRELRNLVLSVSYSSCSRCWLPSTSITSFGRTAQKSTIYGPIACCLLKCAPSGLWTLNLAQRRASASVGSLRSSPARCCMEGVDFLIGMMTPFYIKPLAPPAFQAPTPNVEAFGVGRGSRSLRPLVGLCIPEGDKG